jgi:hypothetical protein
MIQVWAPHHGNITTGLSISVIAMAESRSASVYEE